MRDLLDKLWHKLYYSRFDYALRQIDDGHDERAERIGKWLVKCGFSGGYEVLGRLHIARGENAKAANILQRGTHHFSNLGLLWSLLGEAHSNLAEFDQAELAWNRLLSVKSHRESAIVNIAIVKYRRGRPLEGILLLEDLQREIGELPIQGARTLLWSHFEAGQFDQVVNRYQSHTDWQEDGMCTSYAAGAHLAREERVDAERLAWKAIELDRAAQYATTVIRKLANLASPESKTFRIQVHAERMFGKDRCGFFTHYFVRAVDADAAFEFCKPFEPNTLSPLEVSKSGECDVDDDLRLDGVIKFNPGYTFYKV